MSSIRIILFIFLIASIQNIGANDPYIDSTVSLWRLDKDGMKAETFLCVAALIKPNSIFILEHFLNTLQPLKTIGFYTGSEKKNLGRMENSVIVDAIRLTFMRQSCILIVKPNIRLEPIYKINNPIYVKSHSVETDCGFFIGWYKYPVGSFLIKKDLIIAIASTITSNGLHDLFRITTRTEGSFEKLYNVLKGFEAADPEPFPDAVVSFWRVDQENKSETLLYVGALIEPNWILVPRDFVLPSETFNNIRIYTGRTFGNFHPLDTSRRLEKQMFKNIINEEKNFIDFKIVGKMTSPTNDRFIILVMEPGIRLPTPYTVTNRNEYYGKTSYDGDFVGWDKEDGAVTTKGSLKYSENKFKVEFVENEMKVNDLRRGSFLAKGNDLIAFFIGNDDAGHPKFLLLDDNDSKAIMTMIAARN